VPEKLSYVDKWEFPEIAGGQFKNCRFNKVSGEKIWPPLVSHNIASNQPEKNNKINFDKQILRNTSHAAL